MWVPVGRAQADERRHKHHPARVRHTGRQRFHLGRRANELEIVAQPLDHCASDKDAALQGIFQAMFGAGGQRRNQPVLRTYKLRANILQQKATRAVGVLCLARVPAHLPEQRRLLVAGNACDGHSAQTQSGRHLAHTLA